MEDSHPIARNAQFASEPNRVLEGIADFKANYTFPQMLNHECPLVDQIYRQQRKDLISSNDIYSIAESFDALSAATLDNAELRHRLKNFIPLVLSVIRMTAESSATVTEFRDALEGRLRAIANADATIRNGVGHCSLEELVRLELSPYCRSNQFECKGPSLGLPNEV
jgi:hypothetical protein